MSSRVPCVPSTSSVCVKFPLSMMITQRYSRLSKELDAEQQLFFWVLFKIEAVAKEKVKQISCNHE
jgi:hypothetical protein